MGCNVYILELFEVQNWIRNAYFFNYILTTFWSAICYKTYLMVQWLNLEILKNWNPDLTKF